MVSGMVDAFFIALLVREQDGHLNPNYLFAIIIFKNGCQIVKGCGMVTL